MIPWYTLWLVAAAIAIGFGVWKIARLPDDDR